MLKIISLIALLLPVVAFADPTKERLLEIKTIVTNLTDEQLYKNISFRSNDQLPSPAGAYKLHDDKFLIEYNANIMSTISDVGQGFILFHEMGHIHLKHVEMAFPGVEGAKDYELESDAFATLIYKKIYGALDDEFLEFVRFLEGRDHTVPSGRNRAAIIRMSAEL